MGGEGKEVERKGGGEKEGDADSGRDTEEHLYIL
jgi:hypothetical protein